MSSSSKLKVSVPSPCSQSWDGMSPSARGRFCEACSKEVVDFRNMSDEALIRYLKNRLPKGGCGIFRNDQLEKKTNRFSWDGFQSIWRYAGFAFLALITRNAGAQTNSDSIKQEEHTGVNALTPSGLDSTVYLFHGQVIDAKSKEPLDAYIEVWGADPDNPLAEGSTDSSGKFKLEIPATKLEESFRILVNSYGYQFLELSGFKPSVMGDILKLKQNHRSLFRRKQVYHTTGCPSF